MVQQYRGSRTYSDLDSVFEMVFFITQSGLGHAMATHSPKSQQLKPALKTGVFLIHILCSPPGALFHAVGSPGPGCMEQASGPLLVTVRKRTLAECDHIFSTLNPLAGSGQSARLAIRGLEAQPPRPGGGLVNGCRRVALMTATVMEKCRERKGAYIYYFK